MFLGIFNTLLLLFTYTQTFCPFGNYLVTNIKNHFRVAKLSSAIKQKDKTVQKNKYLYVSRKIKITTESISQQVEENKVQSFNQTSTSNDQTPDQTNDPTDPAISAVTSVTSSRQQQQVEGQQQDLYGIANVILSILISFIVSVISYQLYFPPTLTGFHINKLQQQLQQDLMGEYAVSLSICVLAYFVGAGQARVIFTVLGMSYVVLIMFEYSFLLEKKS